MLVFDASSMIHAWDNYPSNQFPGLWKWLSEQVEKGEIRISEVAVEEISHKAPECSDWLRNASHQAIPVTESILMEALRIKGLLGIAGDRYGSGVAGC